MLLAINIGNTNIRCGVFDGEKLLKTFLLKSKGHSANEYIHEIEKSLNKWKMEPGKMENIVIASVVPSHNKTFKDICQKLFNQNAIFVHEAFKLGELGADIFCGITAAHHLYGGPGLAVDLGTATTFNAYNKKGKLLGVAIAPGMQTAHKALIEQTALLHEVSLKAPKSVIGTTTTTAIQSGVVLGYIDLVEGMIKRFKKELGKNTKVIATGGLSEIVGNYTKVFDHINPHLTLEGIRLLSSRT